MYIKNRDVFMGGCPSYLPRLLGANTIAPPPPKKNKVKSFSCRSEGPNSIKLCKKYNKRRREGKINNGREAKTKKRCNKWKAKDKTEVWAKKCFFWKSINYIGTTSSQVSREWCHRIRKQDLNYKINTIKCLWRE